MRQPLVGNIIFLVSMISWASYYILGKSLMKKYDPVPVLAALGLIGTIGLLPLAVGECLFGKTPEITVIGVAAVLYSGLVATVLGFTVLFWALRQASATQVGSLMYFQPITGVLFAWLFLGEVLHMYGIIGAIFTIAGVVIITTSKVLFENHSI